MIKLLILLSALGINVFERKGTVSEILINLNENKISYNTDKEEFHGVLFYNIYIDSVEISIESLGDELVSYTIITDKKVWNEYKIKFIDKHKFTLLKELDSGESVFIKDDIYLVVNADNNKINFMFTDDKETALEREVIQIKSNIYRDE